MGNIMNWWSLAVWLHVIAGITWVGILYYFNFIQAPALKQAMEDRDGPGPEAISKYIMPRALLWFRISSIVTWLTGVAALELMGVRLLNAFTFQPGSVIIGIGAWLGTIMLINVWLLIWPNQKKILGLVPATAAQIDKAKRVAFITSRFNVVLSIPMLMSMVGHGHGLPF